MKRQRERTNEKIEHARPRTIWGRKEKAKKKKGLKNRREKSPKNRRKTSTYDKKKDRFGGGRGWGETKLKSLSRGP